MAASDPSAWLHNGIYPNATLPLLSQKLQPVVLLQCLCNPMTIELPIQPDLHAELRT